MDFSTLVGFSVWFGRWTFQRGMPALFAVEIPPANSRVAKYRRAALCYFMGFAGLFLCGSLIRVFANADVGDAVAWAAFGLFVIAAVCVLRSASVNGRHPVSWSTGSEMCDRCGKPAIIQMSVLNSESGETICRHWCFDHARDYHPSWRQA
jgi:hypothetical protein